MVRRLAFGRARFFAAGRFFAGRFFAAFFRARAGFFRRAGARFFGLGASAAGSGIPIGAGAGAGGGEGGNIGSIIPGEPQPVSIVSSISIATLLALVVVIEAL